MNLAIDIGNSSAKLALIDGGRVVESFRTEHLSAQYVAELLDRTPVSRAVLATVAGVDSEVERLLAERTDYYLRVDHTTPMPIRNLYATPHTLGIDRLAAAVGAMEVFPGCNILVADLGTAVTIDVVSAAGEFVGGNITLSAAGRFRALNDYTAGLPLVTLDEEVESIGRDTVSAIRSGVVCGMTYELEGYIARAEAEFDDLRIIFTGGDANYFAKRLKNAIFATADLVILGLNKILEYNAKS